MHGGTEFEKLYDEDWWYWHLEDRRLGGAPPDNFVTGDGVENIPVAVDLEGPAPQKDYIGSAKPSERFRVTTDGLAAPDLAAGGVRCLSF